jgi:tRNA(Ile)-lysidine synthase
VSTDPIVEVRRAIREELSDLQMNDLVLVACSGGPDSLALALAARLERPVVGAIVVDHNLQAGSRDVAERTAALLRANGLDPVAVESATVVENGDGMEAAARDARYRALHHRAAQLNASAVLLGQTMDDQAETVLLGLARGSGIQSLAGMPRRRGIYRRPLLGLSRAVVHASLPAGITVFDDPHNHDERFARVRVRNTVLPTLERELGPGVAAALARTADLARDDAQALADLVDGTARDLISSSPIPGQLDAEALLPLHRAIRTRTIRMWLFGGGVPPGRLSAEHVHRIDTLVTDWKGQGAVALPGGVEVVRDYGRLILRPLTQHPSADHPKEL